MRHPPTPAQGNALDMLADVNAGIAWVLRHAAAFGGDGDSFHLVRAGGRWPAIEGDVAGAAVGPVPGAGAACTTLPALVYMALLVRCTQVGQSAGGQLGALALILQVAQAAAGVPQVGASPAWDPARIRGFVGVRCAALPGSRLAWADQSRGVQRAELAGRQAHTPPTAPRPRPRPFPPPHHASGAYNLYALADHLHRRGLYR